MFAPCALSGEYPSPIRPSEITENPDPETL